MAKSPLAKIESEKWISDYYDSVKNSLNFYSGNLERIVGEDVEDYYRIFRLSENQIDNNLRSLSNMIKEKRIEWYINEGKEYLAGGKIYNEVVKDHLKKITEDIIIITEEHLNNLDNVYEKQVAKMFLNFQNERQTIKDGYYVRDQLPKLAKLDKEELNWMNYSKMIKDKYADITRTSVDGIWHTLDEILQQRISLRFYERSSISEIDPESSP